MRTVLKGGGVTTNMKNYSYVAKDSTGKTLKGVMEAEDEQQVQEKVYEQGLFLISTTEALGGTKTSIYKFKTKDLAFSCQISPFSPSSHSVMSGRRM